jgi:hypothetical protein
MEMAAGLSRRHREENTMCDPVIVLSAFVDVANHVVYLKA